MGIAFDGESRRIVATSGTTALDVPLLLLLLLVLPTLCTDCAVTPYVE